FLWSTYNVSTARPPYFATSSTPPVMTPWGNCVRSTSSTTPFLPRPSRSPNQLPVSRGRSQKLPPHVGGTSMGCAFVTLAAAIRTRLRTSTETTNGRRRLAYRFMGSPANDAPRAGREASITHRLRLVHRSEPREDPHGHGHPTGQDGCHCPRVITAHS